MLGSIVRNRALGALLAWFRMKQLEGATVLLHPICCVELKQMLAALSCKLVYVDVDPGTLCVSIDSVKRVASSIKIDVLLNVRTYGYSGDLSELFLEFKRLYPSALIVDDKCLCPPVFPSFDKLPDYIDAELYSTGYSKYVDIGYGGYLIANNIDSSCQSMRSSYVGALPCERLKEDCLSWVDDRLVDDRRYFNEVRNQYQQIREHKNLLNNYLSDHLGVIDGISIMPDHNSWRFNLLSPKSSDLKGSIFKHKQFCSSHYKTDLIRPFKNDDLPVSEGISQRILNLFNDHRVSLEDVKKTVEIIRHEYSKITGLHAQ